MNSGKKKIVLGLVLWLVLMFGMVTSVYASGRVVISVSSQSVNIGDTVTITATPKDDSNNPAGAKLIFHFDTSVFSFVSCSDSSYGGGAGGVVTAYSDTSSVSITLKAIAAGSDTITVEGKEGANATGDVDLGDLASGGVKLTVANAASNSNDQSNLSADNSLSSLKISPGTLSPAFKSSTYKYTASVGEDVTSIAVNATASNSKASVTSVTGNTNFAMGANTVKIVVKAENGTTATYTITVNRGVATETQEESTAAAATGASVDVSGTDMTITPLDSIGIPEGYAVTTYTYNGSEVPVAKNDTLGLTLFYLTDPSTGESNFYIYNEKTDSFYKYQTITAGGVTYTLIHADDTVKIPDGYKRTTVTIGDQEMEGWLNDDEQDFCLVYAMNALGETNVYMYDFKEGTMQRLNTKLYSALTASDKDNANSFNLKDFKNLDLKVKIFLIAFAVLIILCIVLIILLILKTRKYKVKNLYYDDEDIDDDLEEIAVEADESDEEPIDEAAATVEEINTGTEEISADAKEDNKYKNVIAEDALTDEELSAFKKECNRILNEMPDSKEKSETNSDRLKLLDDDFEIIDEDDE